MHWLQNDVVHHADWLSCFCQLADSQDCLDADHHTLTAFLSDTAAVLKHDQTTTVAKLEFDSKSIVLKRYNPRSQGHKFKRALRKSRARRCWSMSYEFARAGLNVAAPILMYEQRFGPIRLDAYFASEFLQGQELLSALPTMDGGQRAQVVSAVKSAFSKMRAAKLSHGDMKASNLLWVNDALFFIDLDAAQQHSSGVTWRAKHAKDKKRFLKNWRDQPALLALFDEL